MNDQSPPVPSARIGEHMAALRRFALSLTRDPDRADDLVQDTMLRAVLHFDRFQPGTNLRAWLFTIERNIHYSNRHRALRETVVMRQLGWTTAVALPAHDGVLALEEFLDAFRQLSAPHRRVLVLVGALGFTHRETAETIRLSPEAVRARVSRARALLLDRLGLVKGETPMPRPEFRDLREPCVRPRC